jgi:sugar O-acyltransferase (sialic acid O-acetyltransferase NeuD family)
LSHAVIIVGAGGHARVVAEAIEANGVQVLGFTDTDPSRHGMLIDHRPVLGGDEILGEYSKDDIMLANGLGSTDIPVLRRALHERLAALGWKLLHIVHPRAIISRTALIEDGAQIMAGAVIQAGVSVGMGTIVNTGAIVDHDCVLGAHCHVAPGAVLSGGVKLGDCCHVGAGSVIIQGIRLGANTLVAAGAVVVRDHPAGSRLIGTPARSRTTS